MTHAERPKAFSYVRMSSGIQVRGDSKRRQEAKAQDFCNLHGLELVQRRDLQDLGVSAYRGRNLTRGALGNFIEAVDRGEVKPGSYLLVESLDRLSRDRVRLAMETLFHLTKKGITIVTLLGDEPVVYNRDSSDEALYTCVGIMKRAHEESFTKSRRMSDTWKEKKANAKNRKLTGMCPSWLRLDENKLYFHEIPERVEIVKEIFLDAAQNQMGLYAIARKLTRRGVPQFRPRVRNESLTRVAPWQPSSVEKILSNRAVLGEFQPYRYDVDSGMRVVDGSITPDYFPPIIDSQLFEDAQTAKYGRKTKSAGRNGAGFSNIFSGIARCNYCKGPMRFVNKGPGGSTYLRCTLATLEGAPCPKRGWRYDDFEKSFLAFVHEVDLESTLDDKAQKSRRLMLNQDLSTLEARLDKVNSRVDRVFDLVGDKKELADLAVEHLEKLRKEKNEIQTEVKFKSAELDKLTMEVRQIYENKEDLRALIDNLQAQKNLDQRYQSRAKLAARLKSLILSLDVAHAGELTTEGEPVRDPGGNIAPGFSERNFRVVFRGGHSQTVFPSSNDALTADAQVLSKDGRYTTVRNDKTSVFDLKKTVAAFEQHLAENNKKKL